MARRRKGQPVSGWLILDKPEGMTSTKAVGRVRYLYDAAKAEDPGALVTYVNYPTTEYLDLSFFDLYTFNVFLGNI